MSVGVSVKFILQVCKQELGLPFQYPHDIKKKKKKEEEEEEDKEKRKENLTSQENNP